MCLNTLSKETNLNHVWKFYLVICPQNIAEDHFWKGKCEISLFPMFCYEKMSFRPNLKKIFLKLKQIKVISR